MYTLPKGLSIFQMFTLIPFASDSPGRLMSVKVGHGLEGANPPSFVRFGFVFLIRSSSRLPYKYQISERFI